MIPNRPLSKIEKKVLEYPSTRFRLRAACNEQKKSWIDIEDIDVQKDQTAFLFSKIKGEPIGNRSYANMWKGVSYPQMNNFTESAKSWIDYSNYTSPIMRHLYCIDAACLEYTLKPAEYEREKKYRLDRAIQAINLVWEILTSPNYVTSNSPFDHFNQTSCSRLKKVTEDQYLNSNYSNLPHHILNLYNVNDPWSIFNFLCAYVETYKTENADILDLLSIDLASLALLNQALAYINLEKNYLRPLGDIQADNQRYLAIFFAPEDIITQSNLQSRYNSNTLRHNTADIVLRNSYRSQINKLGISQADLDSLLKRGHNNFSVDIGLR